MRIQHVEYCGSPELVGVLVDRDFKWFGRLLVKARLVKAQVGVYETTNESCSFVEYLDDDDRPQYVVIEIEKGERTDLASTPLWSRLLYPNSTPGRNIVWVTHDVGYKNNGLPRKFWDLLMKRMMQDKGFVPWEVSSVYGAVRVAGWRTWNNYRNSER